MKAPGQWILFYFFGEKYSKRTHSDKKVDVNDSVCTIWIVAYFLFTPAISMETDNKKRSHVYRQIYWTYLTYFSITCLPSKHFLLLFIYFIHFHSKFFFQLDQLLISCWMVNNVWLNDGNKRRQWCDWVNKMEEKTLKL